MPSATETFDNTSSSWYTTEIQHMMHGFGDTSHPLVETAELVEKIVKEQLTGILELLCYVAEQRNSSLIGIEEFIFVLRRSPSKLRRFCHYLQVRDMKKDLLKNGEASENLEFMAAGGAAKKNSSKNLSTALKFLHHIDPTGYLPHIADPNRDIFINDDCLRERTRRIECMTLSMDVQQYLEYSKARQSSFGRHPASSKFKDWVLNGKVLPNVTIKAKTWDFLSYLAYETVGQIVDLAFVVRHDDQPANQTKDLLERNMVPRQMPYTTSGNQPVWTGSAKPLQPDEVAEGIQRFYTSTSVLTPLFPSSSLNCSKRFLAL